MRDTIQNLGPEANKQWSRRLLRACSAVIGVAALLDFPLIFTLDGNVATYVLVGNSMIVVLCAVIFFASLKGSVSLSALLLGSALMALTSLMPSAEALLNSSTGAALVVPVLLVGVTTNFRLAVLFGAIAIGILLLSAVLNDLAWTPYTYTSAFIIAITVGLLWLVHSLIATVQDRNQQLADYASQAEELAIERERTRLAREIHDGIGHVLVTINMQIEAARAQYDHDPDKAQATLVVAQRYTKDAMAEIRRSIVGLRTPVVEDELLTETVAAMAANARTSTLDVRVDVQGTPRELTPQATFALNRIVQEALTNVRKHAQATLATIMLDYTDPHQMRVIVRDDGCGADSSNSGYGLIGIQERAQALDGSMTTETGPGAGFTVTVQIPT